MDSPRGGHPRWKSKIEICFTLHLPRGSGLSHSNADAHSAFSKNAVSVYCTFEVLRLRRFIVIDTSYQSRTFRDPEVLSLKRDFRFKQVGQAPIAKAWHLVHFAYNQFQKMNEVSSIFGTLHSTKRKLHPVISRRSIPLSLSPEDDMPSYP